MTDSINLNVHDHDILQDEDDVLHILDGMLTTFEESKSREIADINEGQSLWNDLNSLIKNVNEFTTKQKLSTLNNSKYELTNDDNTKEKDDGLSEKMLKQRTDNFDTASDISEPEEEPVQEIDWSVTGPVMQTCISDLQELHALNVATNEMVCRLKKLILQKVARQTTEMAEIEDLSEL